MALALSSTQERQNEIRIIGRIFFMGFGSGSIYKPDIIHYGILVQFPLLGGVFMGWIPPATRLSLADGILTLNLRYMNVLVFATSVQTVHQARLVQPHLNRLAGVGGWNFDLGDCDHILRITRPGVCPAQAIQLLTALGFHCAELDDQTFSIQVEAGGSPCQLGREH